MIAARRRVKVMSARCAPFYSSFESALLRVACEADLEGRRESVTACNGQMADEQPSREEYAK
jgi:hypothetical protein